MGWRLLVVIINWVAMKRGYYHGISAMIMALLVWVVTIAQVPHTGRDTTVRSRLNAGLQAAPDTQGLAASKRQVAQQFSQTKFTILSSRQGEKGFGYYIFADGRLLIDQQHIPAVSGRQYFVSEAEARRTAELAIKKMRQGEMPPTISVEELKALKIRAVFPITQPVNTLKSAKPDFSPF